MPISNLVFQFAVKLQSVIGHLPLAAPFHQVGMNQSTHKENRWSLHPQQLHLVVLVLTVMFLSYETAQAQNAPTITVNPTSLVFAAEQGGAKPATQELNISTSGEQDMTWTVSKRAPWLKLEPITGTRVTLVKASVTTGSLVAETYRDEIILAIDGTEAKKIDVTFVVTPPKGAGPPAPPQNKNKEEEEFVITNFKEQCVKELSAEPVAAGDFGDYISFGPTVAAKAFNYDLASKRVAFNAGVGAGLSMRIYDTVRFKGKSAMPAKEGRPATDRVLPEKFGISQIRKKCRAETYDLAWLKPDNQRVAPLISISPMIFASKSDRDNEIQVQPALTVGFLGELINVGAGFNLSGQDKGHVFILLSLGYGFKF